MLTDGISAIEIEEAVRWRRHLHAHPELAFEENETAAFIASRLAEWGYSVRQGLGRTGLIGTLSKGMSGRAIGLRADMDALPIAEQTGLPYQSTRPGKMHACGHDGHVAMLLAAARVLSRLPFDGTIHLIFQPAEENEGGAREMVRDGLLREFPMDSVYAAHNWPALDIGSCVARDGAMMAAFGTFEINVIGSGSHGAMPHEGADPVLAASHVVAALQSIASRNISPLDAAVVSATQIHGGDAWNVIPERVVIRGTTRWFSEEVGKKIPRRIADIATSVATGFECRAETLHDARYPATLNDAGCAALVRAAAKDHGLTVIDALPSMAAEDFAFILNEKPGCYFWLGSRRTDRNPGLHSPYFDFNDELLPIGAAFWTRLVLASLPA
ncbi:M20 aminoacylase family protein [Rhizobium sp. Root482]|uniref:M20 aminoacylase family protein n=1 Tax=Rhizobium sp. Root482 TaxID=1736543 RepID=UPI0006FE1EB4|nr:M20 aminoacylase family protein [Rhizobium sp. Root482]KQY12284.1 peptidase M20 [Rhizobium sp. Root482]